MAKNFNGTQINNSATIVEKAGAEIADCRNKIMKYDGNGNVVLATAADTDDREKTKHMWDQDQHSLTHTIVSWDGPAAKKGDVLAMDSRLFLVLAIDDAGSLGVATIYYAEERNDLR